jgi:hypothetical protein
MTEIRVCWPLGLHENEAGEPIDGGVWWPDTPENREMCQIIVEAGCEACGAETHWLVERIA